MKTPEGELTQGPIIKLMESREILERKLAEYRSRLNEFGAPETQFDTIYKIAVVERLVETGEVDTQNLSRELVAKYGTFDTASFNNACGVIADYIKTGGKNVAGGTGLNGNKGQGHDKLVGEDDNGDGRVM